MRALGIDTSNYTTSAAVFDGTAGRNAGRLLDVRPGELGLRQSDALFQHVKHLPDRFAELEAEGWLEGISVVGASTRPRAVEGSYMPCFLAGENQGRVLAGVLHVPFCPVSHQQGHIAAAAWSAGRSELLDAPLLAWHLSGGTTELLYVHPQGTNVCAVRIGGTSDLSAGQLIDRTGLLLGLDFPAGKALDARFVLETLADVVRRCTDAALERYPGLPVLCSGGVSSNRLLRSVLDGAVFARPEYSADNAMGVAILARRSLEGGRA